MNKQTQKTMFSSNKDDWNTPSVLFDNLNRIYDFTLDAAADVSNAKCFRYFDKTKDALTQDWSGESVFLNPPYSRKLGKWVEKSYTESLKKNTRVVMLLPARVETKWFNLCFRRANNIYFVNKRIKFMNNGVEINGAPFPSAIVLFQGQNTRDNMAKINLCDTEGNIVL